MAGIEDIKELLATPKKILITMHRKADGDALGSSLALYYYLLKKGHTPVIVSPTDYGEYLHWMPGNDKVVIWERDKPKAANIIQSVEVVFCLDFNALSRIEDMGDEIRKSSAFKIMIDHHTHPEDFDDFRLWTPEACATAELVYKFIMLLGDEKMVDKTMATCLYTGLVTDSGSFRYKNVTPDVHRVVAMLMETGFDHTEVHDNIFDVMTESRLKFYGHCLKENLVVLPKYKAAYITVSKEELKKYNINTGDTEGLVNFPMSMSNIIVGALIIERDKMVKLSIRSKGDFAVNDIARKYFEGGGHINAAGGTSHLDLKGTVERFIEALKESTQS
jgi:phosphoesterase RecJ-like protein